MLGDATKFGIMILYFCIHTSCVFFNGAYYEQLQLQTFDSVELLAGKLEYVMLDFLIIGSTKFSLKYFFGPHG